MRVSPVVLLLVTACVVRDPGDTDGSTRPGTTDPGTTDPGTTDQATTAPTTPTDPTMPDDTTDATATSGGLDNPSGFCSPAASESGCPENYRCCSDDPATTQGRLPNYYSSKVDDIYGVPIFSANNNPLSYSGQCVDIGGFSSPFPSGCPVPCNPTWEPTAREKICGVGAQCCQFQQVDPAKDCILDMQTQRWRSVRGTDIGNGSNWGPQHTTNQDATGASCGLFASGGGGMPDKAILVDCYNQLTVADQRGFCFQSCPCYEDLCDMKNPDWTPRC